MLERVLEPEVMDTEEDAVEYDTMDHSEVNRAFCAELLAGGEVGGRALDLGTGTALIPIELCRVHPSVRVVGLDLAESMLRRAREHVAREGLEERIELRLADAKGLPFEDGEFDLLISNSIVHHIPFPREALAEAFRVLKPGGRAFVRDLLRPDDAVTLERLVSTYAGDCNEYQRRLFSESLHAALTVDEVRALVTEFGFAAEAVQATSDRHWTFDGCKDS